MSDPAAPKTLAASAPSGPNPLSLAFKGLWELALGGSSTTVRLDLMSPGLRRRRERQTGGARGGLEHFFNGWGDGTMGGGRTAAAAAAASRAAASIAAPSLHNLSVQGLRLKMTQNWEGGGFLAEPIDGERKARLDLGVGAEVSLMHSELPISPEARLVVRPAGGTFAPTFYVRALPERELAARIRLPAPGNSGVQLHVDACVPLAYLLNGCKGPSFATMEARFTRPTGTGAHLSTSGLEFDERLLKAVSDDFGLRLAANVDFPRAVGAASGRLGTLDGEPPLRLRVNRLGLKKKICWWKYANAD